MKSQKQMSFVERVLFPVSRIRTQAALRAAAFLIAFSLALAGCEDENIAAALSDTKGGTQNNEGSANAEAASGVVPGMKSNPSIRKKFGVISRGKEGVNETLSALHTFIQNGGLNNPRQNVIRLGDYIDLEGGLTVAAYGEGGGAGDFRLDGGAQPQAYPLLEHTFVPIRLLVVGINSFHSGRGVGGAYELEANDDTPHVVFQFQDIPLSRRRMNPTNTNAGGYAASEMRRYLTPVNGDAESGKFYNGLIDAGVPAEAVWAPIRVISNEGFNAGGSQILEDKVWLPTEREIYGDSYQSGKAAKAKNQTWLEYYSTDARRQKQGVSNTWVRPLDYWLADPLALDNARVDALYAANGSLSTWAYEVEEEWLGERYIITYTGIDAAKKVAEKNCRIGFVVVKSNGSPPSRNEPSLLLGYDANSNGGLSPAFCIN